MSDNTGINWTDATWNPIRGCSRVSPGCENCYAEAMAARFSGPGMPYEGLAKPSARGLPKWTGEVRFVEKMLDQPLRWTRPRRIFVNSMSDLFHEGLSNEQIAAIFGVMAAAPRHTFQVLTKRPERMREWFLWVASGAIDKVACIADDALAHLPRATRAAWFAPGHGALAWPLRNVHLGVTVEDQQRLNERVPILLDTPAAVRWVSAEPLLEAIRLDIIWDPQTYIAPWNPLRASLPEWPAKLDWVVVGGESGPSARPFDLSWARSIVEQCKAAGVPVWVKQLGADPIDGLAGCSVWQSDKAGADWDDWPTELRVRDFPEVAL